MIRLLISNGRGSGGAGWRMALGLVLAAAMGFMLLAVGLGVALLLAPVVIVAGLIARARLRKMLREMGFADGAARQENGPFARSPFQQGPQADVIEGEFRVVEDEKPGRR